MNSGRPDASGIPKDGKKYEYHHGAHLLYRKEIVYKQLLETVIFTFNTLVILKIQGLRAFSYR